MLEIKHLVKEFGHFKATNDVSFHIEQGEFVTILGPSGSGKSTVLRMIAGLEIPTSGDIFINKNKVTTLDPQKREIGLVFQSYALFPNMTVTENISYPLRARRWKKSEMNERVKELLHMVGLEHRAHHYPHQLSGGERQRVALVRSLAFNPPLLLLDEPLSALDAKVREKLRVSLKEIQKAMGVTTVMVTHDQEEAFELSDRIIVMNEGKVEQVGTPTEIYYTPKTNFTASFVGQTNLLTGIVKNSESWNRELRRVRINFNEMDVEWLLPESEAVIGNKVSINVRPESFIIKTEDAQSNLSGQVNKVRFMGPITRYTVEMNDQLLIVDCMSSLNQSLSVGEKIHLGLVHPGIAHSYNERQLEKNYS